MTLLWLCVVRYGFTRFHFILKTEIRVLHYWLNFSIT